MTSVVERPVTEGVGTLHVMDDTGDTRTMWNPEVEAEVDAARAQFDALKAKGYLAYTVDNGGEKGEVINTFDKTLGAIIMIPQVVGG